MNEEIHVVNSIKELQQHLYDSDGNGRNMKRDRPYSGQSHTGLGERGKTEIKGITFRDLRDCYVRAVLLSTGGNHYEGTPEQKAQLRHLYTEATKGEHAQISESDLYGFDFDKLDPVAISQNLGCEVERIMGIYPNIPKEQTITYIENSSQLPN